jgi:hypothetical protein
VSSARKVLTVGTVIVLSLANGYLAAAQQSNSSNSNASTVNTNANTNTNANANTNTNTNQNHNQNTNANINANENTSAQSLRAEQRRDDLVNSNWFFVIVSFMFAMVLIPFAWTIMRAIRFSKSTFNSPLGLPEGSLRAMLAYILVTFLGFYVLASVLSISEVKPPDFLLGIVATVIGFYFGSRSSEAKTAGTTEGGIEGSVVDNTGAAAVGATVNLSRAGVKKFTQTTDVNGKFTFENVPVGQYDIEASLAPHQPSGPSKVNVSAGAKQTVNLKLQ